MEFRINRVRISRALPVSVDTVHSQNKIFGDALVKNSVREHASRGVKGQKAEHQEVLKMIDDYSVE